MANKYLDYEKKNLLEMIEKYPTTAGDCLDAAYHSGLEAMVVVEPRKYTQSGVDEILKLERKNLIKEILEKKIMITGLESGLNYGAVKVDDILSTNNH